MLALGLVSLLALASAVLGGGNRQCIFASRYFGGHEAAEFDFLLIQSDILAYDSMMIDTDGLGAKAADRTEYIIANNERWAASYYTIDDPGNFHYPFVFYYSPSSQTLLYHIAGASVDRHGLQNWGLTCGDADGNHQQDIGQANLG
ncbi:uncharacterized protein L969DRAFT_62296 [Mixia osmundae IAM 14324]|uniref:Uncharacterized protein n=1 Tax=Mixia osmundae (strain CBS 9802 / IAM 14324 / JCM 22182 / KY 12970) TaxID=764103 RepID=G7DVK6_MIXOS|nr:uncharacterized protein L969DRAFT_62296 [Mixia osmundae IAM 14324]KEI39541.1 hypothetical protein L969DRAFT_62296 [Mixia osmundae IAM 14324]GAA94616.1 hypothetical protein E5Q_01268 [Mixia osmundae IAM 14324]